MSDLEVITQLLIQLEAFYQADKWPHFLQTDAELRKVLQRLDRDGLSEQEQLTLISLKRAYIRIYQNCQKQLKLVEDKMARHVRLQEGAIAYATYNEITWSK